MNEEFNKLIEKNTNGIFGQKGSKLTFGNKDLLNFIEKQKSYEIKSDFFYQVMDAHIIEKKGIQNIRKLMKEFSSNYELNHNIAVEYIKEHVAKKYRENDVNEILHSLQLLKDEVDFKISDYDLSYHFMYSAHLRKEQIQSVKPEFAVMALAYLSDNIRLWNSFNGHEQTRFLKDCISHMPYVGSQYYRKHINILIKSANIDWLNNENTNLLVTCCDLDQIKIASFILSGVKKEIPDSLLDTTELFATVSRSDDISPVYDFLMAHSDMQKIYEKNSINKEKLNIELIAEKRQSFKSQDVDIIEYYINNVNYEKRISDAITVWFEKNNLPEMERIKMENMLLKKDSENIKFNVKATNRL